MFTGIVEELGYIADRIDRGGYGQLVVRGSTAVTGLAEGDSLAVDGVCLTVTDTTTDLALTTRAPHEADAAERAAETGANDASEAAVALDVVAETLRRTTLGLRRCGDRVNLERAVTAGARLDGHIVQGHIDGTARLVERIDEPSGSVLRFVVASDLGRYIAPKGSIALDGTSLTVVEVLDLDETSETSFTVALIPTTLTLTTLGAKRADETVNIEVDVVAKYVERLTAATTNADRRSQP